MPRKAIQAIFALSLFALLTAGLGLPQSWKVSIMVLFALAVASISGLFFYRTRPPRTPESFEENGHQVDRRAPTEVSSEEVVATEVPMAQGSPSHNAGELDSADMAVSPDEESTSRLPTTAR